MNKACLKDDFSLPFTEMIIDSMTRHKVFSFVDGSLGYSHIKMAPEDAVHTAFTIPKGVFCYKVMPFGLQNARATYQRAMIVIFGNLLHKEIKCYVDDLIIKISNVSDHLEALRTVFKHLRSIS